MTYVFKNQIKVQYSNCYFLLGTQIKEILEIFKLSALCVKLIILFG